MNYKIKNILAGVCLMAFILTFAITAVVFFKPLYYFDLKYLHIHYMGLSFDKIKQNYDILIQYQSILFQKPLMMPNFVMSEGGKIHFEEVKRIFEVIQVMCFLTGIHSLFFILDRHKHKDYRYLKVAGTLALVIPSVIGFLAALNFNKAFVIFHKIFFKNDFWIFDSIKDPIINVLPEAFFMHCFMTIVALVILGSLLCFGIYRYKAKQILKTTED